MLNARRVTGKDQATAAVAVHRRLVEMERKKRDNQSLVVPVSCDMNDAATILARSSGTLQLEKAFEFSVSPAVLSPLFDDCLDGVLHGTVFEDGPFLKGVMVDNQGLEALEFTSKRFFGLMQLPPLACLSLPPINARVGQPLRPVTTSSRSLMRSKKGPEVLLNTSMIYYHLMDSRDMAKGLETISRGAGFVCLDPHDVHVCLRWSLAGPEFKKATKFETERYSDVSQCHRLLSMRNYDGHTHIRCAAIVRDCPVIERMELEYGDSVSVKDTFSSFVEIHVPLIDHEPVKLTTRLPETLVSGNGCDNSLHSTMTPDRDRYFQTKVLGTCGWSMLQLIRWDARDHTNIEFDYAYEDVARLGSYLGYIYALDQDGSLRLGHPRTSQFVWDTFVTDDHEIGHGACLGRHPDPEFRRMLDTRRVKLQKNRDFFFMRDLPGVRGNVDPSVVSSIDYPSSNHCSAWALGWSQNVFLHWRIATGLNPNEALSELYPNLDICLLAPEGLAPFLWHHGDLTQYVDRCAPLPKELCAIVREYEPFGWTSFMDRYERLTRCMARYLDVTWLLESDSIGRYGSEAAIEALNHLVLYVGYAIILCEDMTKTTPFRDWTTFMGCTKLRGRITQKQHYVPVKPVPVTGKRASPTPPQEEDEEEKQSTVPAPKRYKVDQ